MTMRIALFPLLVTRERAQARMAVGLAAAQAQPERRKRGSLEVPDDRDERQSCDEQRSGTDEQRGAAACAAAAKRACDDRSRADAAEQPADCAADRFLPVEDEEADQHARRDRS